MNHQSHGVGRARAATRAHWASWAGVWAASGRRMPPVRPQSQRHPPRRRREHGQPPPEAGQRARPKLKAASIANARFKNVQGPPGEHMFFGLRCSFFGLLRASSGGGALSFPKFYSFDETGLAGCWGWRICYERLANNQACPYLLILPWGGCFSCSSVLLSLLLLLLLLLVGLVFTTTTQKDE